jgi:serine/threonine-protein kinase
MPPDKVPVPTTLVGGTKANAESTLKGLGLNPVFKEVSSDQAADIVVSVPDQGKKVDPGSDVTVNISKGNQLKMPKVTGESLDAALAVLENSGPFNVDQQTTPATDPSQVGTVVAQNPKPGTKVEKGDTVKITVAIDVNNPSGDPSPTDTSTPGNGGGGGGTSQTINQAAAIIRPKD